MSATTSIHQWTADGLAFQHVSIAAGSRLEFRKIFHDAVVVLAFTGATWESEQAGTTYLETPDCVVVRPAGQVFSARLRDIDASAGSHCREIHIPPERLAEMGEASEGALATFVPREPVVRDQALARELLRVHELFESGACTLEATTALAGLLRALATRTTGRDVAVSNAACSRRASLVIAYLREHFADKVTLPTLAKLVDANPYVLLRQFRRETGGTPHDYLSAYRINRAKQYIAAGVPLSDVAFRCGFADQSHFNRQFKGHLGLSPTRFQSISSKTLATTAG